MRVALLSPGFIVFLGLHPLSKIPLLLRASENFRQRNSTTSWLLFRLPNWYFSWWFSFAVLKRFYFIFARGKFRKSSLPNCRISLTIQSYSKLKRQEQNAGKFERKIRDSDDALIILRTYHVRGINIPSAIQIVLVSLLWVVCYPSSSIGLICSPANIP